MRRTALRDFFRQLVLTALPLGAGCNVDGLPSGGDLAPAPRADAACGADLLFAPPPFTCPGGGYVPVSGPLPQGPYTDCTAVCPKCGQQSFNECLVVDSCQYHGVYCFFVQTGRRPAGLREADAADASSPGCDVGQALARMAWLEAASVPAFRQLARELFVHGAPSALVARARRAANDEVRHARTMTWLAGEHGVAPERPTVRRAAARPLLEVARDNAVEGCVREGFGALCATFQSRAAQDEALRAAMAGIAWDETEHAELAWAIARWAEPRLGPHEREVVADARRAALAELVRSTDTAPPTSTARALGLPDPPTARALATAFAAHVGAMDPA